ncbi:DUF5994 family protein [Mycobacterium cookii]|uniref:Uncharacterized protein n=1 Tax=Mycobacterium cookii TaxID=1775 RepID=A0A7I7KTV4_9MYCO|nr:DUF5994 family protein [Mycobacterium cookii]MCV7330034.1 hypothetical protein [Mycobacterium cookii]BBX45204.1 hypothetical protein MCOO_12190 [Mycobacterium cookii]
MTLKDDHVDPGHKQSGPEHTPRLRLKPKAPQSGYVDGAWWPHSDDLAAELPDLLAVLSVRLGPISRVVYRFDEWSATPRKLSIGERVVRLDGYSIQPAHTVEVLGLNRHSLVLLVVSPHADPEQAHAVMMTAAGPSNALTVDSLLTTSAEESDRRISR